MRLNASVLLLALNVAQYSGATVCEAPGRHCRAAPENALLQGAVTMKHINVEDKVVSTLDEVEPDLATSEGLSPEQSIAAAIAMAEEIGQLEQEPTEREATLAEVPFQPQPGPLAALETEMLSNGIAPTEGRVMLAAMAVIAILATAGGVGMALMEDNKQVKPAEEEGVRMAELGKGNSSKCDVVLNDSIFIRALPGEADALAEAEAMAKKKTQRIEREMEEASNSNASDADSREPDSEPDYYSASSSDASPATPQRTPKRYSKRVEVEEG